jgi:hypothetical protein
MSHSPQAAGDPDGLPPLKAPTPVEIASSQQDEEAKGDEVIVGAEMQSPQQK